MQKIHINARTATAIFLRVIGLSMAFTFAGLALADPPTRVARLGYFSGAVSFSPAGETDWVAGTLNRPLVTGDRLWADDRGRVELQIGNTVVRLGARTLFTLTNLDDRIAQMNLQDGTINLRVRRLDRGQVVEVNTPNLAFVIRQAGEYRMTVNAARDSTEVRTRSGRADVYGKGASYAVGLGRAYRFFGAGLVDYDVLTLPRADEFDRWGQARDSRYDTSISARYVSRDVIGFQDLDQYGSWRSVPEYGNVWTPTRVAANWAPYRDGHWSWVEPWGWTWVDDLPWGFAVSHYGRWINSGGSWGWIPGPTTARAVYAPALVAFIGGSNFQVSVSSGNVGAVGWFPLGPREVYRPAYAVSREYFTNVNISNTVINNTTIINNYDNRNSTTTVANAVYVNQRVPGAVVAVPTTAFVQSQPVARAATRVSEAAVIAATVTTLAAVAPTPTSVRGAAAQRSVPPEVVQPRFVAQSQPPAPAVGFAVRERALTANPGKPVDTAVLAAMKPGVPDARGAPGTPAAAVVTPRVEIVPAAREASAAVVAPPPRAPSDRTGNREQAPPPAAPADTQPPSPGRQPSAAPAEAARPGNQPRERRDTPTVTAPTPVAPPAAVRGQPNAQPQPAPAPVPTPAPAAVRTPTPAPPEVRERGNQSTRQRDTPAATAPTPGAPPAVVRGQPNVQPQPTTAPPEVRERGNQSTRQRDTPAAIAPTPGAPPAAVRGQPNAQPQPAPPPAPTPAPAAVRTPTPAPPEVRERGNKPSEPSARPVTAAPVQSAPVAAPPPPRSTSPGNPARGEREVPGAVAPVPPPSSVRVPPSSPAEPPPAAAGRATEPGNAGNPPPRSANGEKKPAVVDEKRGGKKDEKVDEDGKPIPDDQ